MKRCDEIINLEGETIRCARKEHNTNISKCSWINRFGTKIILPMLLLSIILISGITMVPADAYKIDILDIYELDRAGHIPYVDPVRAYYDAKQAESREIRANVQPTYYEAFELYVPAKIECDTLVPIHGIVPHNGLLTWTIISGNFFQYTNLSNNSEWSLINYIYIPCDEITERKATISSTFIFNDPKDNEIEPNTKVKDLRISSLFIHIQKEFEITGRLVFTD